MRPCRWNRQTILAVARSLGKQHVSGRRNPARTAWLRSAPADFAGRAVLNLMLYRFDQEVGAIEEPISDEPIELLLPAVAVAGLSTESIR